MKCKGTAKSTGKPCQLDAMRGSMVCHKHGGSAPQVRAKARERLLAAEAAEELARLDVQPIDNPLVMLADLLGQAAAFKDVLAVKVNDLGTELRFMDAKGAEQLRSEVALWERALDRCERFAVNMARLNIDTRLVAISEQQHAMVLRAVDAALDAAAVPPERRGAAKKAAAGHLRLVESA